MELDDIKKLSPEERVKKLKELQEKRKTEIEEARKLLVESEHEIALEEIKKDIPIPQLTAIDTTTLFSEEERDMFRAKRFETKREKEIVPKEDIRALEKMIADEKEQVERFHREQQNEQKMQQYGAALDKALEDRRILSEAYDAAKSGNVSYEQMKAVYDIKDRTDRMMQYKMDSDMRKEFDVNERIVDGIRGVYRRNPNDY